MFTLLTDSPIDLESPPVDTETEEILVRVLDKGIFINVSERLHLDAISLKAAHASVVVLDTPSDMDPAAWRS